jgi:hypothetical protein
MKWEEQLPSIKRPSEKKLFSNAQTYQHESAEKKK